MKLAIVYTSITGNTKELATILGGLIKGYDIDTQLFTIEEFPLWQISQFDGVVVGTYTWGNGEIPEEILPLFRAFETQETDTIVTGVFGTGDQFYPHYCGAVDKFRDMLYVQSELAVTLKVELTPQLQDLKRCRKFAELLLRRLRQNCPSGMDKIS
ncbi:flavodoxin [Bacillus salipaludis]|uniref:Flavodoxin n=1 Tax=Bacillus salipaludis TaxID=2547811 RepID=A0A4R5VKW6_9BACI|nr:flavodoxin domain-containing protein [Bacillus salipaludis]MDQ6595671.1 flavodoxin domain-containing protein [Bacillus salipaludis]TDK58618.1 flavodoxin [Bacillus salipaludis]